MKQLNEHRKIRYSEKDIEKALLEILNIKDSDLMFTYSDLRNKVLSGYAYTISSGDIKVGGQKRMSAMTGKGGVLMYIDVCKEKGIPAYFIAQSIIVHTDEGSMNLLDIKIKKNDKTIKEEK